MGCTNSKERPRTPPPADAALQSAVSDGDGFWAANGEQRASRDRDKACHARRPQEEQQEEEGQEGQVQEMRSSVTTH